MKRFFTNILTLGMMLVALQSEAQHIRCATTEHEAALQQQIAAAQEEANRNVAQLQAKLADAASMGEAQRKALEAELTAAKEKQAQANENAQKGSSSGAVRRPTGGGSRPAPAAAPKPSCPPGDPMCGGL